MAALPQMSTVSPGNTAKGVLTFSEGPPTDGAVVSSDPTIATIALAADGISWTVVGAGNAGAVTFTYTGTSVLPDVGPCVVAPMTGNFVAPAVAETGDFNPASAVIT